MHQKITTTIASIVLALFTQAQNQAIEKPFAFSFYQQLIKNNTENLVYSPFSLLQGISMVYEGANGITKAKMANALSFSNHKPDFYKLNKIISNNNKHVSVKTSNALWAQKGYRFIPEYISLLEKNYSTQIQYLNFTSKKSRKKACSQINKWVKTNTENKINKLISTDDLDDNTRLVLTNAVWFKAKWQTAFKSLPDWRIFTNLDQSTSKIPMMQAKAKFNYFENKSLQVIELPYHNKKYKLTIILPKKDTYNRVEKNLSDNQLRTWQKEMNMKYLDVQIPKLSLKQKIEPKNLLSKMGMSIAFSDSADFSGITGKTDLKIDKIIQQATIDINEEGTEAAAATAVIMVRKTAFIRSIPFIANHPFLFILSENETGTILFMGRYIKETN